MRHIYTSIDLGSDTVKALTCELYNGKLNLLASSTVKSTGIRKGVIVDFDLALASVSKAIGELENDLGIRINKVIVNVPSYFSDFNVIRGKVSIEKVVTGADIVKVLQNGVKGNIEPGKEMLTIIPIDFAVDDETLLLDPKGKKGKNLFVRAVLITMPKKNIYSVINLFDKMGIEVDDISINEIGDLYAFKNERINNSIGIVVNIGHNITTVSLFNKGIIVKNSILQMGGSNVTNDLSYIFKLDLKEAEMVKEKFAVAKAEYASVNDVISINNIKLNQKEVSEVVESRLEEILNFVKKEIYSLTDKQFSYIIITGGTVNINYFDVLLKQVLGDSATIGKVKLLGASDNRYSAVIGNIVYYINKLKLKGENSTMVDSENETILSSPRKNTNETMISKVINFFANE